MHTIVLHTILETELGIFFVCLIRGENGDHLTCHPIKESNGVDVAFPPVEIDDDTRANLTERLLTLTGT